MSDYENVFQRYLDKEALEHIGKLMFEPVRKKSLLRRLALWFERVTR